MANKIRVAASDLTEALKKAAQQLKVSQKNLAYVVLQEKKGFLGLNRMIELEVWVKEEHTQPLEQAKQHVSPDNSPQNGAAAVVQGKVVITNPRNGGELAMLIPSDKMMVKVNGQQVTIATPVKETDQVEVELGEEPGKVEFTVQVDKDLMQAEGILTKVMTKKYQLQDSPSAFRLVLLTTVVEEDPGQLSREQIMDQLAAAKVVFGIDEAAVQQLMKATSSTQMVVAKGVEGKQPVDETVEFLYEKKKEEVDENKAVDHWEKNKFISVEKGETLAVKTPAKLGEKGIKVNGQEWEPRMPRIINLKAGDGVEFIENGMKAIATKEGQPVVKSGTLMVLPVLTVKAVNLETGNIRFNGTVQVQNNVEENMILSAKEDIEVYGSINEADVKAGGHIKVSKNVVASSIHAGGDTAAYQNILKMLTEIPPVLSGMKAKANVAREAMGKKGVGGQISDGYLIKIMLEKMHPEVPKTVKELVEYGSTCCTELDEDVAGLIKLLQATLMGLGPTKLDFNTLSKINQNIYHIISKLQQKTAQKSNIEIGYLQNSTITASGDVIVSGKGGYNSDVNACGAVRFTGRPGVFRGGSISAGGDVEVGELGSPTGAITNVTIPKHFKLIARIIHPNVSIKIGNFCEKVQQEHANFEAWVSERGLETSKTKSR